MAHQDINQAGRLETSEKRPGRLQTFSALKHKNYRHLWVGSAFISAGNQIQQITMGWYVLQLTGSPFWVGTVLGLRALPILVVGPMAGVAVDRLDRKKLFLVAQIFLVLIAFLFALDVRFGHPTVTHAVIFSVLLGLDAAISQTVRQSLIVNTVTPQDLTNAIALNNMASGVVQSIAPLVSGVLIATLGVHGNFFIQSGAYMAVFLIILPMKTPYREAVAAPTSVGRSFKDGIRYIRGDLTLLLLIVLVFIPSIFVHSTQNLLSVFAKDVLGGGNEKGPLFLGLLGACAGVGSLLATLTIASLGNIQIRGRLNMASILLMTVMLILFGLSPSLGLSLVLIGLMSFFNVSFRLVNNALVQSRTPDALRGRVTSIYVLDHGFQPVGSVLLGFLAGEAVPGAQMTVVLAGIVALAATAFIGLRFRQLWRLT